MKDVILIANGLKDGIIKMYLESDQRMRVQAVSIQAENPCAAIKLKSKKTFQTGFEKSPSTCTENNRIANVHTSSS